MSSHFLLSAAARTLSLAKVLGMSDAEAEETFAKIRWAQTDGKPVCPHCGCSICYDCRRSETSTRWRCKACRTEFSLTSGTLFAYHKLPIRMYLAAIVLFVNAVKGISALQLGRDLDVQYKTAFVLAHKLREAMAAEIKGATVGGPGTVAEIDGAYFGGHVRPENKKADRKDRRLAENQSKARRVVVVIRERAQEGTALGTTVTRVFGSEEESLAFIKARVEQGTTVHADESAAWNALHARYRTFRVNHSVEYRGDDGACTNQAESYFSRLRRAEIGQHHHISGVYLHRYAAEMAWREDHRRDSNGVQFRLVAGSAARLGPSVDFCGYWQRSRRAA